MAMYFCDKRPINSIRTRHEMLCIIYTCIFMYYCNGFGTVTIAASVEDGGFGRIVDLCLSLGSMLVG